MEGLKEDLLSRGYRTKIIDDAFKRVMTITREEALKKVVAKKTTREVLSVTYHPGLPAVSSILKRHHKVMTTEDPEMQACFNSLVSRYIRYPNLKYFLIRSKVPKKHQTRNPELDWRTP